MWKTSTQVAELWINLLTYNVNKEQRFTWIKSSQIERIEDHSSQKDCCVVHTINGNEFTVFNGTAEELVQFMCKPTIEKPA